MSIDHHASHSHEGRVEYHRKGASYGVGFVLSLVLIGIIYTMVTHHWLDTQGLYLATGAFAFIEAIVIVFCFLLLNTSPEDRAWNTIAFLFTILVVFIVVVGSLWIMYNLNYYMV